jgi:hypothetical protein
VARSRSPVLISCTKQLCDGTTPFCGVLDTEAQLSISGGCGPNRSSADMGSADCEAHF